MSFRIYWSQKGNPNLHRCFQPEISEKRVCVCVYLACCLKWPVSAANYYSNYNDPADLWPFYSCGQAELAFRSIYLAQTYVVIVFTLNLLSLLPFMKENCPLLSGLCFLENESPARTTKAFTVFLFRCQADQHVLCCRSHSNWCLSLTLTFHLCNFRRPW